MIHVSEFLRSLNSMFANLFDQPDWRNLVDICILALLVYQVIKLVRNTRAKTLFKGIAIILVMTWVSDLLQLSAVNWLLQQVVNMGILLIVIVFQPELRRALDQLGRSQWTRQMFSGSKKHEVRQIERSVAEIVTALTNMSRKRIGALIVFERNTGLGDVVESGAMVNADISDPLIENIFEPNTPLHDGAMVIRNGRIVAAACILQLSDDYSISRELGTRHRAALGITEATDAVSLIVSEETGIISMARDGKLTRYMDGKSLTILLTEIMSPQRERSALMSTVSEQLEAVSARFGDKGEEDAHE